MKIASTYVKKWKVIFKDERDDLPIGDESYSQICNAKEKGKSSDFIRLEEDGTLKYFGEVGNIKEIKETDLEAEMKKYEDEILVSKEEKRRFELKKKREEWTKNFLSKQPEDFMDYYREWAKHDLQMSIRKGYAGEKFIEQYAYVKMRQHNNCPIP